MQAMRKKALIYGASWVVRGGSRGSKGLGWYQRFQKMGPDAFRKARAPTPFDWEAQHVQPREERRSRRRAFFDITVDGVAAGRVEFELAADLVPVTCENFVRLCKGVPAPEVREHCTPMEEEAIGEEQGPTEEPKRTLCYQGTMIHRLVKGTGIMGGDVEGTNGTRSHSALGTRSFPDEAFFIPHSTAGILTMATSGVHSNGSQFYVTTEPAEHLDGRSVAFGRVIAGMEVVRALHSLYSVRGKPVSEIKIEKSGELEQKVEAEAEAEAEAG